MDKTDLIKHPFFVAISSLIVGTILTSIVNRLRNRMTRIKYYATINRIGASSTDPVFGNIRVSWNTNELRNLYVITLSFENTSNIDIGDLDLKFYVDQDTMVLSELSSILNTSYIVPWSDSFKQTITIPPGQTPTELQSRIYFSTREYHLKVFNRFQRGQLIYLCTRPNDDLVPSAWLESPSKGVQVRRIQDSMVISGPILGVPMRKAALLGIITSALVVLACSFIVNQVWLAALIGVIIGLTASLIGTVEYRLFDGVRKHLSI